MRHHRLAFAEQSDFVVTHVTTVGGEEAWSEEVVRRQKFGGTHAVVALHEFHLGPALIEVDGVVEVVFLRKLADGRESFRGNVLCQGRSREHTDASTLLAM